MKGRTMVGALLASPVLLVAAATPSHAAAAAQGAIAFAGTVKVVPGSVGAPLSVCFSSVAGCGTSTGQAAGAIVAKPIAGMRANVSYTEPCVADRIAPTGTAAIDAQFADVSATWTNSVHAKWQRYGTIAVLTGNLGDTVAGAALFVPLPQQVPACGQPLDVAIVGAAAFA
jgi:hypothetical protein